MLKLRQLRCSFCRKNENEVLKLVAGPRVYICDACVATASQIMSDPQFDNQLHKSVPRFWHRLLTRVHQLLKGPYTRRVQFIR